MGVCVQQDSTEGEDILLLPQENSTTVQECLICSAALLHTRVCDCSCAVVHARVSVCLYKVCVCVCF